MCSGSLSLSNVQSPAEKWLLHGGSLVPGVMAELKEQESVLASALLAWEVTL